MFSRLNGFFSTVAAVLVLCLFAALCGPPHALAQSHEPKVRGVTASVSDNQQYDVYEADATAGALTVTLLAPSKRREVVVVKTDSSANAVTVATAGTGATINGASSYVLRSQHDSARFVANGKAGSSGFWRVGAANRRVPVQSDDKTIATTGNTDFYVIAPESGVLVSAVFSGVDALAANDSNYVTFSITNLGQAGAGSAALLAATDANTTKATGGAAVAANTVRALALSGTAADLVVAAGDRLRVRAAATGTLANTVTFSTFQLRFATR